MSSSGVGRWLRDRRGKVWREDAEVVDQQADDIGLCLGDIPPSREGGKVGPIMSKPVISNGS